MMPVERIVLIGLPGAGKSTVGRALAENLDWQFIDFDEEISGRTGKSVSTLFQSEGESAFRAMEARLTAELCSRSRLVLAPGGGWAAQPGLLESVPAGTAVVWLRVTPEEAIGRLRGSPVERPLLAGPDPLAALRELAARRQARYARADLTVDVDGRDTRDITNSIMAWLKRSIS